MPYFRILLLCFKINKNKGYHFNKMPIPPKKVLKLTVWSDFCRPCVTITYFALMVWSFFVKNANESIML